MAELSVLSVLGMLASPVIQELVQATGKSLAGALTGIRGVRQQMDDIQRDLEKFRSLLKRLDRSEHAGQFAQDDVVTNWIGDVRSMAQQVEDILEDHMYETFRGAGGGAEGKAKAFAHSPKKLKAFYRTAGELEKLETQVNGIRDVYHMYVAAMLSKDDTPSQQHALPAPTMYFFLDIIREKDKAQLEGWIKEAPAESSTSSGVDARSMIIAVWGMGGQGKTTLVRKIYNDLQKSKQFNCLAWVNVSRTYHMMELLRSLAFQLCEGKINPSDADSDACTVGYEGAIDGAALINKIRRSVRGQRYVIVFDDVWEVDFWGKIQGMLDGNLGSRILITTREKRVASALARPGRVLDMDKLSDREAWSLFSSRSFWSNPEHSIPGELEHRARDIVNKCEGLPLAIVAAATVMSTQGREVDAWEKANITLGQELDENRLNSILMHGWYQLPHQLKRCFLYCAIFPERYLIKRKLLLRLWVAEGFIVEEKAGKTKEDVAQDYLEKLIAKSMIEVAMVNENGRVKACTIHDEYRNAALKISRKQKFLVVHDRQQETWDPDTRRLSLHNVASTNLKNDDPERLRSMFVFPNADGDLPPSSFLSWKYKLLRVLDLRNIPITEVPKRLFKLYNLRYLSLRNTKVGEDGFTEDLENLHQLLTLDLWNTEVKSLPRNVLKLQNLEHLMFCQRFNALNSCKMTYSNVFNIRGREAPKGIWDMKNLRTLKTIEANEDLISNIHRMEHLRTLSITKLKLEHCQGIVRAISRMSHLQRLALKAEEGEKMSFFNNLNTPPPQLQKLQLNGPLRQAPVWFRKLNNLTHMYLFDSQTNGNLITELQSLTNLVFLVLDNAFSAVELLHFGPQSFPKLRILYLDNLQINKVVTDRGALPVLEKLYVSRCTSLGSEWQGTENLSALRELFLREPTKDLEYFLGGKMNQLNVKLQRLN